MRTTLRKVALLAAVAPALLALRANPFLTLGAGSRVWIAGTSTVRSFTCEAPGFDAQIDAPAAGAVHALLDGRKAVKGATLRIPVAKMDCGNGTMNSHMTKALKSADFPVIAFTLGSYELGANGGTISGQLTLGGVTKPVTLKAAAREDGGALRLTGAYELNMTQYGIKPPTLMMGTMKVGETVKVHFDLLVKG